MTPADTNALNNSLRANYVRQTSKSAGTNNRAGVESVTKAAQRPYIQQRKRPRGESLNSSSTEIIQSSRPGVCYDDLGGIESALQDVRELIERPLIHPELYSWLGVEPPRGILLHGPPGCGKTMLANAIAGELGVPYFHISAPEIVSGMSGESEAKIRGLFQSAKIKAPSLIFIDEIDAITPKRDVASREMERRIVAQLLTSMDDLCGDKPVIVIGATNRPDSIDQALRRAGRFDREICLGVPDQNARSRILKVISSKLRLSGDFDFDQIAAKTPGYVGADLQAIAKEAASLAVNRIFTTLEEADSSEKFEVDAIEGDNEKEPSNAVDDKIPNHQHLETRHHVSNILRANVQPYTSERLESLFITMEDFIQAIKHVQPSAKREGFATIPNVSWDDIGALTSIRKELEMSLIEPIRSKVKYSALALSIPLGVLLYGPPGCGKTLLAKAVANQAQANFISIKGPELLNKFVGESERAVRLIFQRARASSPCIIFFDEVDALIPKRSGGENVVAERVVNQLLVELDGLEQRGDIFVIAATNRPDIVDPAMMRPGRLDKLLYVPIPTPDERVHILKTCARRTPLEDGVDLEKIAYDPRCEGYSGADLASLVREASMFALELTLDSKQTDIKVSKENFDQALNKVHPSVSRSDRAQYAAIQKRLFSPRLSSMNPSRELLSGL